MTNQEHTPKNIYPAYVKVDGFTVGTVRYTVDAGWVGTTDDGAECAGFVTKREAENFVRLASGYEQEGR